MDEREIIQTEREVIEEQSKKRAGSGLMIGMIAALILVGIATVFSFSHFLNEQLFLERQTHLLEITEKVAEVVDVVVEGAWGNVNTCQQLLIDEGELQTDNIQSSLNEMTRYINTEESVILAFDERASYYTSDGNTGHWGDPSIFLTTAARQEVVSALPYRSASETYMMFIQRLENKIPIQGTNQNITHIAMAIKMSTLQEAFTVSGFADSGYTCVVNAEGRRIYRDAQLENFIEGYNIITAMKEFEVVNGGTIEDLRAAVGKEEKACLEFVYNDVNYYVGTSLIPSVKWEVMLFVPTDVLGANTNELVDRASQYFLILGILAAVLICMAALSMVASRTNKKLVEQEKASNMLLAKAANEAESANRAKSEFLSHMSHDIRTPINGIMGMTGIAVENIDDKEKTLECLNKIDTVSHHLLSLINDVLDMSRVESGKTVLGHSPMDIRVMLDNCASIIDGQLMERDIDFRREFGEFTHPLLLGDELRLRQIFINILGNATKFTPDGGTICFKAKELSAADDKVTYRFEIEDTGKGMKQEFLEHIFEPFSQEDGMDRSTYKGTGLGMSITKQFVDLMGGNIFVESELYKGSKFTVEVTFDICHESIVNEVDEEIKDLSGMKVLLVEDNELNMEIAKYLLESEEMIVTTVENGKEAVDMIMNNPVGTFDAVLMDVMMPVMDGIEATKEIRAMDREDAKEIPIIAMTANAYEEDVKRTRDAGMNDHLLKPIDEAMLFRSLSNYYKKSNGNDLGEKEVR